MSMLINILCALFVVCLHFLLGGTAASLPFCCFNQLGNRCGTQKRRWIQCSHLKQNVESVSGNQHFARRDCFILSCLIQNQLLHFDRRTKWN